MFTSLGGAVRLLEEHGIVVTRQTLANWLHRGKPYSSECPMIGNRRIIPLDVVPRLATAMREFGY